MKLVTLTLCAAVAAMLAGCVSEPVQSGKDAKLPDPGADKQYTVIWPEMGRGADRYIRLTIGDDVAADCNLVKPHFEFDSAETRPQDVIALRGLADCLNAEKRRDLFIRLTGRADPRGDLEYNRALGERRAEHVKRLLIREGVSADRIVTTTRGETESVGSDDARADYSFGYDRRVDIKLLGVVHAPR
jgi:peptidoglycan-associated lipoprotein